MAERVLKGGGMCKFDKRQSNERFWMGASFAERD